MSRKKLIATAIVLTLILAIGGILAYFTSTDTKVNKFKMSNVGITVDEPNFEGNETHSVPVVPNQQITKDPIVINNGDGEVYAFVNVKIPRATVKTSVDGTPTEMDLFTTIGEDGEEINSNWVLVNSEVIEENGQNFTSKVYAYVSSTDSTKLEPLAKDARTNPVFDAVKFAGVVETDGGAGSLQGTDLNVTVSGYGIQKEGLESDDPATVWPLIIEQYS